MLLEYFIMGLTVLTVFIVTMIVLTQIVKIIIAVLDEIFDLPNVDAVSVIIGIFCFMLFVIICILIGYLINFV